MHRISVGTTPEGVAVVNVEGELDAYAAPDLASRFASVRHAQNVVTDLSGVSFLDSTALGVVVRTLREIRERGGDVRVVLPETSARRIFEITMIDQVLPLAATREEALADLAASGE